MLIRLLLVTDISTTLKQVTILLRLLSANHKHHFIREAMARQDARVVLGVLENADLMESQVQRESLA